MALAPDRRRCHSTSRPTCTLDGWQERPSPWWLPLPRSRWLPRCSRLSLLRPPFVEHTLPHGQPILAAPICPTTGKALRRPTTPRRNRLKPQLEAHIELAQRIQTLFAFAQLSQRPLCVVKNVTSLAPSETIARGADHSPPAKVASLFYEFLVESYGKHVASVSELILNTPGAEAVETDALWMDDSLFLSSGAAALTRPVSPQQSASGPSRSAPKAEQQRSFIQIRHDSVNADTYSCLRAALASDGEGALLTRTARTISLGIEHVSSLDSDVPPFTINERMHLDSLMWDRRQGMRLDAELRDLEMVRLDALRQELEARKRKLLGDSGRPSTEVLQGAQRYFEQVASAVPGADAIRSASLREAAPQITKILEAVRTDLAETDRLIAKIRAQIDAKRAAVASSTARGSQSRMDAAYIRPVCSAVPRGQSVHLVRQAAR